MPLWARLISPGRSCCDPPPTSPMVDEVWCGARNGGREDETARREAQAAGGVGHRGGERLLAVERGQQAGQALGEHRLAAARRADEEQVMTAGRRHLQGVPRHRLAAHVGEVGHRLRHRRVGRVDVVPRPRPGEALDDGAQIGRGVGRTPRRDARLDHAVGRRHDLGVSERVDHRGDPRHRSQRPVEAELGQEGEPRHRLERHLAVGGEHPDGDGQVEPGARLAHTARGEVHHDRLVGPRQLARHHGGAHPVARLAADRVRLPDQPIAGKAAPADVHLDAHRAAVDAEQRGR